MQTGFARTGKLFAIEHSGVEPDLITVAKSIAAGCRSGVLGKAEILDAGTTAPSAAPTSATRSRRRPLAVLDVIEEENLCERAVQIGETMRARCSAGRERYAAIGDAGRAMLALELVEDRATKQPAPKLAQAVIDASLQRGLLLLKAGVHGNAIRPLPARAHGRRAGRGAGAWEDALGIASA